MNVFIIVAVSADGLIAKNRHHLADWTSKEDKKFFIKKTKQAGVIVMGGNTYRTIGKPLPNRLNIVYSRSLKSDPKKNLVVTTNHPNELIKDLEKKGYKEVAICGGSNIYTMFLKEKLVDTIYLTIEPLLFGKGLNIFNEVLNTKLKLKAVKKLSNQSVLIKYTVLYQSQCNLQKNSLKSMN